MASAHSDGDELTFLTLGDGDFSFSLDLARYLAEESSKSLKGHPTFRLVATGFDSLDELAEKYKDAHFTLRQLRHLDSSSAVSVSVHHSVNAVDADAVGERTFPGTNVIFNHPHLGTEDSMLHSQFLCHLFHAVDKVWLKNDGLFHLTLANGQFERWNCLAAAERQSMVQVDRCPFQSPPVKDPYYRYRRHQTGKSFANRTPGGSETITFARRADKKWVNCKSCCVFWYSEEGTEQKETPYECPYCDRTFREKRSVKNHIQSKHDGEKKRKRDAKESWTCPHCGDKERIFESSQALNDHMQAKHNALHTEIAPDWSEKVKTGKTAKGGAVGSVDGYSTCDVCGLVFTTQHEAREHGKQFAPSTESSKDLKGNFKCSFCSKSFRERRAVLQHENFCTKTSSQASSTVGSSCKE